MRLGRAGAIGAARSRAKKTRQEQELVLDVARRAAQNKAINDQRQRQEASIREDDQKSGIQVDDSDRDDNNSHRNSNVSHGSRIDMEAARANQTGSIIRNNNRSKHDISSGILIPVQENINVSSKDDSKIVFRRYPCTLWLAGTFILCCGLYLIYHLALGHHGTIFKGYREGHWWQYMVAIVVMLLGLIFLYGGKVESVVFDKDRMLLELHRRSIICLNNKKVFDLSRVSNIRCVKKGHDGVNFYTLHYVIQAEFPNEPPIKILESSKREKIVQQSLLIRNFLGMFTSEDQLNIYDISTRI